MGQHNRTGPQRKATQVGGLARAGDVRAGPASGGCCPARTGRVINQTENPFLTIIDQHRMFFRCLLLFSLAAARGIPVLADDARIAVAANFAEPAAELAESFEQSHPHSVELVSGSSARFYAQVRGGAPFDAFLSADREKPALLVAEGLATADSLNNYATGRLVLWTALPEKPIDRATLAASTEGKIALANPRLAPYGLAAREVIDRLGVAERLAGRLVMGENISQAYQFVAMANAPLGFVALSQVGKNGRIERGSGWLVPTDLHTPIRQYAVLLNGENAAAAAFLAYLRQPAARRIIQDYGYAVEAAEP